jgi:CBS domain containing-hemolysin-like protein
MKADRKISVSKVIEPPVWVPESVEIAELVRFLLNTGNDKACVLDEFGSFCGVFALSTGMNKFLEVVFPLTAQPQRNADIKTMMFSGAQDIGQIQAWLPEELKNSDIEARTLNGLLTNYIGKIPKTGDRFVIDGWDFYIILANPTKIESVLIRKRNEDEY